MGDTFNCEKVNRMYVFLIKNKGAAKKTCEFVIAKNR